MLGARRRDLKSSVLVFPNALTTGQTNLSPQTLSSVATGLTKWAIRSGEGEPGGSRARRDHLLVIGAGDDPPRPRSGLRGFGNTRLPPIVKMLATQIQSTRPVSITPTITHSISHPKPRPPSVSPRPPAHFRVFYSSCCTPALRRSTCARMLPRWPCACSLYNRSSPQPKSCVRQ